jgi:hypothetical protein
MTLPESLITSLSIYLHDLTAQRKTINEVIVNLESFVRLVTPPTLIAVEAPKSKKGKSKKKKA